MKNNHINYLEFVAKDLVAIKTFYSQCFGWTFTDYGPNYVAFDDSGLQGGFERSDESIVNGVLVVLYHDDLDLIKERIVSNGGVINKDTFSFPGGKRFQFIDPAGNELAVWSDKE